MLDVSKASGRGSKGAYRARLAAVVLTAVLGAVVGLWLWLPSAIRARAESGAALRGLIIDIDDVNVSFASVVLAGVRVRGAQGTALDAEVERVRVGIAMPGVFFGLHDALRSLAIEGASVVVDTNDPGFRDTFLAIRGANAEKPAGSADADAQPRVLPPVTLVDGSLELRDGAGALASVSGAQLQSQDGSFTASAERAVIGSQPGEVVTLEALSAHGLLRGARPQLESLEVGGGVLRWVAEDESARGRTLQRVRAVRDRLKGDAGDAAVVAAGEASAGLWAPGASLEVHGLRILSARASGGPTTVLRDLDVKLEGAGEGRYRARGTGASSSGEGRLQWDLYVQPEEARVEGNVSVSALPLSLVAPLLPPIPWHGLDRSRVDARLTLKGEGLEQIGVEGELTLADVMIAARGISHDPVGPFGASVRGKGRWIPAQRRFELRDGSVNTGGITLALEGAAEWAPDHYLFDLTTKLHSAGCADVLAAVPRGVLGELEGTRFEGSFAGTVRLLVDSRSLDETVVDFDFDDHCVFLSVPELLRAERFRRPFIHRALEPEGEVFEMETGPGTPAWTAIEHMSPFFIQAVISHEDGSFFRHDGFAEKQIAVALSRNLKAGAYKFGASTITMQLVKNVFLHREKLLARKVQEAMITWWLEQHWSKRDILELYLNVIEYGPSVYGVRNAAWYYFGVTPAELSPAQGAFLATILPNPKSFHAQLQPDGLTTRIRGKVARLLEHMHHRERIDEAALTFGLAELDNFGFYHEGGQPQRKDVVGAATPLPFRTHDANFDAWDLDPGSLGLP